MTQKQHRYDMWDIQTGKKVMSGARATEIINCYGLTKPLMYAREQRLWKDRYKFVLCEEDGRPVNGGENPLEHRDVFAERYGADLARRWRKNTAALRTRKN